MRSCSLLVIIEKTSGNVIVISSVLGDEPIYQLMKRSMDEALGLGTSKLDILERYRELIDTLIIYKSTKHYNDQFEKIGMEVLITTIRLLSQENIKKLAKFFSKLF